jgi:ABC-type sugar transport system ATPase subunit
MGVALQLAAISKSFSGVAVVKDVDFDVHAGEVHALMGENGAGKSTLIKIVSGVYRPDGGEIRLGDRPTHFASPREAVKAGIATVHQELLLFPELTVAENIFLGHAPRARLGGVSWSTMRRRARDLLDQLHSHDLDVEALVRDLSVANRQRVEIARALSHAPKVLILDEPTAALSDVDAQRLLEIVRALRARGVAIVYVSHRMAEVFDIADRVTVLRDGRRIDTQPIAAVDHAGLVTQMVGRRVEQMYPKVEILPGPPLLQVRELTCGAKVHQVSFDLHAGEIVGIAGLIGSGRTELAQTLFGITPATSGQLRVMGEPVVVSSPAQARDLGVAYVPEDRGLQGLIRAQSVRSNVSLASLARVSVGGMIDHAKETAAAQRAIQEFGIRARGPGQPVWQLSGGNQQKVVLAKWLATDPRIVILDEPTRGIDVGARAEIYALISRLAQQGLAILVISSDLPEVLGLSDRVLVMSRGRVVAEFARGDATPQAVGAAMTPVETYRHAA